MDTKITDITENENGDSEETEQAADFCAAGLPTGAALAYFGDAVHSFYVRRALVRKGYAKSADLHTAGQQYVTAAAQAAAFDRIAAQLTEDEAGVARRARNSHHLQKPKHMSVADYRKATGLEALLGMLALTGNTRRLEELMAIVLEEC